MIIEEIETCGSNADSSMMPVKLKTIPGDLFRNHSIVQFKNEVQYLMRYIEPQLIIWLGHKINITFTVSKDAVQGTLQF